MNTTIDRTPVEELSLAALYVEPVTRDWSEGYGEDWDYVEAPTCPECGSYCVRRESSEDSWEAWRCDNLADCNRAASGEDVERGQGGDEGPMMNYAYALPDFSHGWYDAAEAIRDLPLCIVYWEDDRENAYELALTGGGVDLSWEICEAYMRLGYLPPIHYCDLPGMCGRGTLSNDGVQGAQALSERDRWIIDGCKRSVREARERWASRLNYIERSLNALISPDERSGE